MASGDITLAVQKDSTAWDALQEELTHLFKGLAQEAKNTLLFPAKGQWHVDVLLSDSETVCTLNHQYRGKNKPTNVLSFPQTAGIEDLTTSSQTCLLGDIVLCWGVINAEALEQKRQLFIMLPIYLYMAFFIC
jgi:rRNA maturation RNase YbeY